MAKPRIGAALALVAAIAATQGCSVREYAMRSIGDALAGGGEAYAADDDIELVGAATPFGLKTIETVLEAVPDHRALLLAAARGFTQYAYVYVQLPADEVEERDVAASYAQRERARRLFLRARDYGLRGLNAPGGREDVALHYWTALAWAAAISLSKDDPKIIAGLPQVDALVTRATALDADYGHGALRSFLIGYELNRANAAPDAIERARAHFAKAVELSEGKQAGPYVSLAESVALARRDRREFEALLKHALAIDPGARREWRLENLVMQRRARRLLANADELFPE